MPYFRPAVVIAAILLGLSGASTAFAAPTISSLSPNSGAVGSAVVIAGSGFGTTQSGSTVKFNGKTAAVTSWGATSITATVPTGATTGPVVVTVSGHASNSLTFTVTPAPSISSLNPSSEQVGATVAVNGSNFGSTQGNGGVTFNGTAGIVSSWSSTSIAVAVPVGASTGNVVVTAAGGVASSGVAFTVLPPLGIASLLPNSGAPGATVALSGVGFGSSQGSGSVAFNGATASIVSWSDTTIFVVVPAGATSGNVAVTTSGGRKTRGAFFAVVNPNAVSIDQIVSGSSDFASSVVTTQNFSTSSPNELLLAFVNASAGGSAVISTVSGAGLTWVLVERTNAQAGTAEIWRAFSTSPLSNVTVSASLSSGSGFTGDSSLTIMSFFGVDTTGSNGSGAIGAIATGNSSAGAPSASLVTTRNNSLVLGVGDDPTVAAGRTPAAGQVLVEQFTDACPVGFTCPSAGTTLWVQQTSTTVAAAGTTVNMSDTAPSGDAYNLSAVEILASSTPPAQPLITSLSSFTGAAGSSITLSGVNFGSTQGASTVTFNGTAATPVSWSATSIVLTVPSSATTGNVVVNVGGQSSNALRFIVVNAGGLGVDQTVFADGEFAGVMTTPAFATSSGNQLLLTFVSAGGGAPVSATSVSGGGLTWTLVKRTNTQQGTAEIWGAFSPFVLNNISVTANLINNMNASMTVATFVGVDTSGVNGAGAIGATGTGNSGAGAPTATLTSTRSNSMVLGAGVDPSSGTARTPDTNQSLVHQAVNVCVNHPPQICPLGLNNTLWVQQLNTPVGSSGVQVTIDDLLPSNDPYNLSIVEVRPPTTPPLTISASASPAANAAHWNNSNVTVSYTCSGGVAPVSCPSSQTVTTEGANQVITATATDAAGHSASASVTLNIDKTAPSLSITSPANGTVVTTASAPVAGTVSDSLSGVAAVTCDGAAATVQSGAFSCSVTLTPGSNSINVQASDVAGNATPQSVSETFSVPSITSFTPASAPTGTVVTISGSNFAPNGLTPLVTLSQQGGGTIATPLTSASASSISFIIPAGAATGPLTVTTGGSSASSSSSLTVVAHTSYTLAVGPASATVQQGSSVAYTVSLNSSNGFSQLANLSVSGLPAGVTASFSPVLITNGQISVLTVTAPAGQPVGNSTLTVSASATVEGIASTQTANVGLAVQPATTSLIGRTVESDTIETPLAGITITLLGLDDAGHTTGCSGQTVSDAGGNFAFVNLPTACLGRQLVGYNGNTATDGEKYASVNLAYTLVAGQITGPELVHLPQINNGETIMVKQNASSDQVFSFSTLPGVVVTVYAGTIFTEVDGSQPNPFPMTGVLVPVDRLPDTPIDGPGTLRASIVAFQPADTASNQPVSVTFPNVVNTPPGVNMELDTLDPVVGMLVKYGTGTVSGDGTQIVPDPDPAHPGHRYGIQHFDWHGPMAPARPGVNPCPSRPCAQGGDPVDLSSGLLMFTKTDISFGGARGVVSIDRTYRSLSGNPGPFGVGTSHNYGYELDTFGLLQGGATITLVMPDGNQQPFIRQADGVSFVNSTIPALQGAVIKTPVLGQYSLRWKSGMTFTFQSPPAGFRVAYLNSITDPNGNTVTLVRGNNADPLQITKIVDPVGRSLGITYDNFSRITSLVDPIGRIVAYTYNNQGTLATVTDPAGGVTTYAYDPLNRITDITDARGILYLHNDYDATGRVTKQTAGDGGITTFNYTLLNPNTVAQFGAGGTINTSPVLQTTVTDPVGNRTVYHYSPQGFLIDVTDALGQKTAYTLDPATNQVLEITDPLNRTTAFTYDAAGNTASVTRLAGTSGAVTTSFVYDPVSNRPTSVTNALGFTTLMTYDTAGNLLSTTDPLNHQTTLTYDATGELVTTTNALGNKTQMAYTNGNLSSVTDPLGNVTTRNSDVVGRVLSITTPLGQTSLFSYDPLNQLTKKIDALGGTTIYTRDANGNLLSVTDPLGHTTSFTFDSMDRLTKRIDPLLRPQTFRYDLAGNLVQFIDRRGKVTDYTYDGLNRRISAGYGANGNSFESTITTSYDAVGRLTRLLDSSSGTITDLYDPLDRLVSETTPQGSVSYGYDAGGRRTTLLVAGQPQVSYSYDKANRLTQVTQGTSNVGFSYDIGDRRTLLTLPNGASISFAFDNDSRITGITYNFGGSVLGNLTYAYDSLGRRTQVSGSFARTNLPAAVASAVYDAANELTNWNSTSLSYDSNGNMLADGSNVFTWNARNQAASLNGANLQYDGSGRRIKNAAGTSFLYDGATATEELSGLTSTASILSGGADQIFQRSDGAGTVVPLSDGLGSTIALLDASGNIKTTYSYDPFGNTTTSGAASANPSQYTGRENDGNGVYFYRARYYSPVYGRFLSEDPMGFAAGINFYGYADDNPISFSDPFGLDKGKGHGNPFGIRAPGQSFGECLSAHEKDYSLVGLTDLMLGTDFRDTHAGELFGGNHVMSLMQLAADTIQGVPDGEVPNVSFMAASLATGPTANKIANVAFQTAFNYSLNATPIISKGAGMSFSTAQGMQAMAFGNSMAPAAAAWKVVDELKMAADVGFTLAEFVGCSMSE